MEVISMVIASKLASIAIIFISVAIGFLSYYLMSNISKEQRKKNIEEMVSQLINLIIFIWLAKTVLNIKVFIRDPLVILAYPSNAAAFYLAILFSAILLMYKNKRNKINISTFIESCVPVFLVTSFVYEFIQFTFNDNTYSFGYLILLMVLLIVYIFLIERIAISKILILIFTGWSVGMLLLIFLQPFATVFGYIMASWFVWLILIAGFCFILIKRRKKVL